MEVTSLTSALKQVYNIHKNIVSELNAKIDVLVLENKNLKCNNLKEECLSCVQLKDKTQRLRQHFTSLLKERESVIDQLKSQVLNNFNDSSLLTDRSEDILEEHGSPRSPNKVDSKSDSATRDESCEVKHSSKLRLIRERKRRNRYQEEVPETKRRKNMLDLSSTLADSCNDEDRVPLRVLVPETEKLESFKDRSMLNVTEVASGEHSSQKILVVSETVDMDDFMNADALSPEDLALEEPERHTVVPSPSKPAKCKNSIDVSQNGIENQKKDVTESGSSQASFHKDIIDSNSKKLKCQDRKQGDESPRVTLLGTRDGNVGSLIIEHSTLSGLEDSDRKTKSLIKKLTEKALPSQEKPLEMSQVFPGHTNKQKNVKNFCKRSVEKNKSTGPASAIHADSKAPGLQVTTLPLCLGLSEKIVHDERFHVPVLGTCDLNGSLNPDVHLSEFLVSQSTENLCLEKNKMRPLSAVLDETVAPDSVLHLHSKNSCQNSRGIKSPAESQCTSPQSDSDSIKTVVNKFSAQQDGNYGTGASPCLPDSFQFGKERVSSEDEDDEDDEVVGSSPLHRLQVSSQLGHSISSSFKFMPKHKQQAHRASDVKTDRWHKESQKDEKADYVDVEIKDDTAVEFFDVDEALEELEKTTVDESPDTVQNNADTVYKEPSLMDSFDRVPQKCKQEVPHVQVVRKKSEKNKLEGYSCQECYQYYKNSGLSDEAMKQKMNECSRHRAKYLPASTPDHFWSIGFPDTSAVAESPNRRESDTPLKNERNPRRRRRLEKRFKSRNEEETQK